MEPLPMYDRSEPLEVTTPCRLWRHANINGYGIIHVNVRLHRWVVAQLHGWDAIAGLIVIHRCDNNACYRYDHLRVGTQADNMFDKRRKGRSARGSGHSQHKLSEADIPTIRAALTAAETPTEIAKRYAVTRQAIHHIRTGRNWKHIS